MRGLTAEARARLWLRLKGYAILAQRYKCPLGEIDIIARKGKILCFVEVKARARLDLARAAISPAQQRRIMRAAALWIGRNRRYAEFDMRFDAVLVAPGRWPRHIAGAFADEDGQTCL
jgi:putative endonuclease